MFQDPKCRMLRSKEAAQEGVAATPTFMNSMTCACVVRASRRRRSALLSPAGAAAPTSGAEAIRAGAPVPAGLGFASATASSRACTAHRKLGERCGAARCQGKRAGLGTFIKSDADRQTRPSERHTAIVQMNRIQQVHRHFTHRVSVFGEEHFIGRAGGGVPCGASNG